MAEIPTARSYNQRRQSPSSGVQRPQWSEVPHQQTDNNRRRSADDSSGSSWIFISMVIGAIILFLEKPMLLLICMVIGAIVFSVSFLSRHFSGEKP